MRRVLSVGGAFMVAAVGIARSAEPSDFGRKWPALVERLNWCWSSVACNPQGAVRRILADHGKRSEPLSR